MSDPSRDRYVPIPRRVPNPPPAGTSMWFTWNPGKWNVRKRNGWWWVWRPNEDHPIADFREFPYDWNPDCESFLKGFCNCRSGCAR